MPTDEPDVRGVRKSCVHGFLKNEAGLPLGPFRRELSAEQPNATAHTR